MNYVQPRPVNRTQRRAADKKAGRAGRDFTLGQARRIANSGPRMRRANEPQITWVDQPVIDEVDPVEFKMIVEALGIERIHGIILNFTCELQMKLGWEGDLVLNQWVIQSIVLMRAHDSMRSELDGMAQMRLAAAYPNSCFWKGRA